MSASVNFQNGNKEVTVTVIRQSEWVKGDMSRIYFELESNNKRTPIRKLYEVIAGTTRDAVIEAEGRRFAVELGIDCDSKTKRAAAMEAANSLIKQLVA